MKMRTSGPRPVEGDHLQNRVGAVGRKCQRQSTRWQRLWARWQQLLYQQPLQSLLVLQLFQLLQLFLLLQQLFQLLQLKSHMQIPAFRRLP